MRQDSTSGANLAPFDLVLTRHPWKTGNSEGEGMQAGGGLSRSEEGAASSDAPLHRRQVNPKFTCFTCFTSTKVQKYKC